MHSQRAVEPGRKSELPNLRVLLSFEHQHRHQLEVHCQMLEVKDDQEIPPSLIRHSEDWFAAAVHRSTELKANKHETRAKTVDVSSAEF